MKMTNNFMTEISNIEQKAKMYIADALMAQLDLGKGSGPLLHNFDLNTSYAEEKHI